MLNPSTDRSSTQQLRLEALIQLINSRPIAFWGGLWTAMILVTVIAVKGLLSPGEIEGEKPEPSPETKPLVDVSPILPATTVEDSQAQTQYGFTRVRRETAEEGLPLGLFGAIALTCATGTLLIYSSLKQSKRRKPTRRTVTGLRNTSKPAATIHQKPQPPRRRRRSSSIIPAPSPVQRASVTKRPVVTVLPPEENHPLDGGENNLVDMMDLRKRQSLTSLLRDR